MSAVGSRKSKHIDGMEYETIEPWQQNPKKQPTSPVKSGAPKVSVKSAAKVKTKSNSKGRISSVSERPYGYVQTSATDSRYVRTTTDGSKTTRTTSQNGSIQPGHLGMSKNLGNSRSLAEVLKSTGTDALDFSKTSRKESKLGNLRSKTLGSLNKNIISTKDVVIVVGAYLLIRWLSVHLHISWS